MRSSSTATRTETAIAITTSRTTDRTGWSSMNPLFFHASAKKYEKLADKQCAGTVKKYEKGVVSFIEARNKKRLALYDAVKGLVK